MSGSLSGPTDILVAVAVVALVLARQLRPRRVTEGRSWWILPAALVYFGGQRCPEHLVRPVEAAAAAG